MTRLRAPPIVNCLPIAIPKTIIDLHSTTILSTDHLFIQYILFLYTISRGYEFRTIDHSNRKKATKEDMEDGIKKVINVYRSRGIHVHTINTCNKFEYIKKTIQLVHLNVIVAKEHVSDVERSTRTVEEGTRGDIQRLPHTHYLRVIVRGCVIKRVKDLNQLPSNNEMSTELSPTTLLAGNPSPDFLQVINLNFEDFAHSYNAIKIYNTPKSRVVRVLVLYPSGNEGSWWIFMPLATGREIHRNK